MNMFFAANPRVEAFVAVCAQQFCCLMQCLLHTFDNEFIQPFMPNRSVIALDILILLQFARLDTLDCDVVFFRPLQKLAADVFWSIIDPNAFWSSPPLDDPV